MSGAEELKCIGWAALEPKQPLVKHEFVREPLGPNDCEIDIICCGICHSDIHLNDGDFPMTAFPNPQVRTHIEDNPYWKKFIDLSINYLKI